ncbi:hypothetical protein LEN26_020578 [Aphanomyces euteiches]|nr:hypothetical protein LEN26_020578 [Aphanomyces euteiches]KAH9194404.1 hypothetical protein AeNC1_003634 [Aphanomyces euteiches]
MNRAIDDMQHKGGLTEFATRKPLQRALIVGFFMYALSFVATWHRVWWDSIIGLLVTVWGYYSVYDVNIVPMGCVFDMAYYATMVTFVLHGIAFGIIADELATKRIVSMITSEAETSTGLLIFVLVVELALLGFTGVILGFFYQFRYEIKHGEENADKDYRELI